MVKFTVLRNTCTRGIVCKKKQTLSKQIDSYIPWKWRQYFKHIAVKLLIRFDVMWRRKGKGPMISETLKRYIYQLSMRIELINRNGWIEKYYWKWLKDEIYWRPLWSDRWMDGWIDGWKDCEWKGKKWMDGWIECRRILYEQMPYH